jgi:hypothetical protein
VLAVLVAKCALVALKHYLAVTAPQVFVLVGPAGAGRTSLARLLLNDYPSKLVAVPLLTNRCVPQTAGLTAVGSSFWQPSKTGVRDTSDCCRFLRATMPVLGSQTVCIQQLTV